MTTRSAQTNRSAARNTRPAAAAALPPATAQPLAAIARIERIDDEGRPWLSGAAGPARVLAGIAALPGDTVLVAGGLDGPPVVVGVVRDRLPAAATVDGERLELTAEREITLRCGEASVTLTRAGKVILAGTAVLSRAKGVNRIVGGSVQIN